MFRQIFRFSCFVLFVVLAHMAIAQEFSADIFTSKNGGMGLNKVYAGTDKVRFEVQNGNAAMGPAAIILDVTQRKYTVLMPQRHMYMDAPAMMTKPLITKFWRVDDVNDACPQWKKSIEEAGSLNNWGSCTKIGSDTLNGRSTVKYEGVSSKGDKNYVWVDTKLHCVVKTENQSDSLELRNIQEGSQAASLFEIPAGFTKFDMGNMMQQRQ